MLNKHYWMMDQIVDFFKEEKVDAEWDCYPQEENEDGYWIRATALIGSTIQMWTSHISPEDLESCHRIKDLSILATELYLEYQEIVEDLEAAYEEGDL